MTLEEELKEAEAEFRKWVEHEVSSKKWQGSH